MELFWIWLIIGLVLLAAELLSATFVLVFFGLGGLVTALFSFLFTMTWPLQIVLFATISTILLLVFRKRFLKPLSIKERERALSPDIDSQFTLTAPLPAQGESSITYQGSPWTAVNSENATLEAGTLVRVTRTEGIKLFVQRVSSNR